MQALLKTYPHEDVSDHLPPIDETYARFQGVINGMVAKWIRTRGGDWDAVKANADYGFSDAYKRYQPRGDRPRTGNGKWHFGGWLGFVVWKWLLEWERRGRKRPLTLASDLESSSGSSEDHSSFVNSIPDHREKRFDATEMFRDSSPEAKHAVAFLMSLGSGGNAISKKIKLIDHLIDIGWSGPRITACWDEIRSVLEGR